jgi:hypothetical protein
MDIRNSDNEFIEDSLDEFEEHLDSHFGDTALPDLKVDDCLTVNDHKVTPKQAASIDGRKVVGGPRRAAISEEPTLVVGRGGERRPYGYGHEVPLPPRKPCPISEHAKANPVRSNLRVRSPRLPDLDATEEAELFQKTRDGDEQAGRKLIDHFHGWVRYAAWKPWLRTQKRNFKTAVVSNSPKERAETIDDYVAAGMLALWEAIRGYASGANNKFNAYARKRVYGAISNVAWAHKAGGIKSETDLARFIRSHFNSPLDVLKKFAGKYTPPQVYQEIARQGLLVGERDDYSEGSTSDQGSDSENQGCHIAGSAGTPVAENGLWYWRSHDGKWVRYDAFNKHALSPHLRHHGLLSKHIDAAALDADLRARRRLREIGRPAYAQELVDNEQK